MTHRWNPLTLRCDCGTPIATQADHDRHTRHGLTPGQWQAVDAIVATHSPSPDLVAAVEQACAEAWATTDIPTREDS